MSDCEALDAPVVYKCLPVVAATGELGNPSEVNMGQPDASNELLDFLDWQLQGTSEERRHATMERSLMCLPLREGAIIGRLLCGVPSAELTHSGGFIDQQVARATESFYEIFSQMFSGRFDPIQWRFDHARMTESNNPLYLAAMIGLEVRPDEPLSELNDRLLAWLTLQPFGAREKGILISWFGLYGDVHRTMTSVYGEFKTTYVGVRSLTRLGEYSIAVAREILTVIQAKGTLQLKGGNCKGDPDMMFAEGVADQRKAARICEGCPLRARCLAHALVTREKFGVWGGETEVDRQARLRITAEGIAVWAERMIEMVDGAGKSTVSIEGVSPHRETDAA